MNRSESDPFRVNFYERMGTIVNLFDEVAHKNRPNKGQMQPILLLLNSRLNRT